MTDFSTVRVCLVFEKHPTQDVAEMLNQEYGGLIEPDFLIVGDDMRNAVIIDNPLIAIKAHIVNLLIELGIQTSGADEDAKRTTIGPLFVRAPIKLLVNGGQPQRRITKDNVIEAFTAARSDASQTLFIKVGISHLFFNMDEHQTFLNWDDDRVRTDSAFPASTASATAPTAPTPPATTSGPIPSSADITSMANAFAAAFTAAAPAPAPAPAPTPAPIPTAGTAYSGPTSLFTFNRNAFPPDVQGRIQDKENGTPIIGSDIKQSFVSGFMHYHNTGQGILVSTDGSVFVDRAVYDEKNISKHYISFANTTHSGIRSAYELLTLHLTDHGVYCHPLYCFRPSSLKWGFSCGNGHDDDVPLKFNIDLKAWSGLIAPYLGNEKVIAKNNTLYGIVQSCGGDGYAALMNIIQSSHPAYHETPSILLQKYPSMADDEDTYKYWSIFQDHLKLQSYVMDSRADLSDKNVMDIFIHNHKYSKYLTRRSAEDRRSTDPARIAKYQPNTIVQTLNTFLLSSDSPTKTRKPAAKTFFSPKNTRTVPIQQLSTEGVEEYKTYADEPGETHMSSGNLQTMYDESHVMGDLGEQTEDIFLDDDISELNLRINSLRNSVNKIKVPENKRSKHVHAVYKQAINAITRSPATAFSGECIVCKDNHAFVDCPILQNTEFLKEHYICYCSALNREQRAREQTLGTAPHTMNFVDSKLRNKDDDYDGDNDDEQRNHTLDFSRGRR